MITIVVPVFNEKENVGPLLVEINDAASHTPITEIIFVDDCSTDGTYDALKVARGAYPSLRVLKHGKKCWSVGPP